MHDLVIDNATVYDGLGGAPQFGGVAVKDGRIVAVGADLGAARKRVDAGGLALAPGIVDIHTHYDAQLTWDPFATPSTALGVTTVVIGNCGFTIAPCRPADRDLTLRALTHVEGMSLEALRAGVRWDFETYPDYLDAMERRGVVPNVGSFVGHSSVRTFVLGADATKRAATDAEIAEMRRIVAEAVRAGAIGFATSTLEQHNGENGIPMPSRLADARELLALTGALGEAGRGVFMLTKGNTTTVPWLEKVAAASGRPVMIAAMFVDPGDPTRVFREVAEIEAARRRGRELWAQVGCFPLGMEFTLRHPYPLEAFLAWRPAIEAADEAAYRHVLADPSFRKRLKEEAAIPGVPNRFSNKTWPSLTIMSVERPEHHAWVGQTIGALAAESGRDPFDVLLDFGLDGELDAMFDCRLFNTDEDEVRRLLRHPYAAVALSDAGAHLWFLCDAGFGLHLFGHWVRERGDLTLPDAVKRVTSDVAAAYRIADRGRVVPGAWADLLLFDPATVARGDKRRVNDLPTGAARLHTPAVGVHGVWVNGVRTVDERGIIADCGRPGRVLCNAGRFDVIHCHVDYLAYPFCGLVRTPTLHTLHGRLDLPYLVPLFRDFPDVPLVSISNGQRAPLAAFNLNWAGTVYHGMPLDGFPFVAQPGEYLAFLGRLSPEKQPDVAIEVAKRAGMPLRIAAKIDANDRDYVERVIRPLLDDPLIEFIGELDDDRKAPFLGGARALLFPIDWPEPFGLVMIEAMACGTPVIARPCGSVPEVVQDRRTGFIADTVDELVEAVKRIDTIDRAECRRYVERQFSVARMVDDYEAIYRRAVSARQAA